MASRIRTATLEFLGTGTSTGVPVAGCGCGVCRSADPRDKRYRSSVLIRHGQRNLIIDTGPEFRLQCIRAGVMRLDAVAITHGHADHVFGFDDVRSYSFFRDRTMPVWAAPDVIDSIRRRFDYIWNAVQFGGGLPDVDLRPIAGPFSCIGLDIVPIPIKHGRLDILGFRIGDLAYMTDISALPDASLPLLENLNVMIISCVRYRRHRTHLNIAGAKRLHQLVRPKQTLLTHLTHYFTHRQITARFPAGVTPAYDGMQVEIAL